MGLWEVLWVPALPTDIYRERERKYTAAMRVLGIVCSMTHLVAFLGNCTIGIFVLVAHTHKQIRVVCVGAISWLQLHLHASFATIKFQFQFGATILILDRTLFSRGLLNPSVPLFGLPFIRLLWMTAFNLEGQSWSHQCVKLSIDFLEWEEQRVSGRLVVTQVATLLLELPRETSAET